MRNGSRFGRLAAKSNISYHRPSMTIFLRFGIPFKNHRFRYSILYQIEHFLTQTLQDHISSIWLSFQEPRISCARLNVEGLEVWVRVFDSRSKGSRFGRLDCFQRRRVRGLGACIRFKVEGFEVLSPGFFFKVEWFDVWARMSASRSKGSMFGRLDSL